MPHFVGGRTEPIEVASLLAALGVEEWIQARASIPGTFKGLVETYYRIGWIMAIFENGKLRLMLIIILNLES